jgi:uncharacterized membrane protein YjjP (DUF1212 family)
LCQSLVDYGAPDHAVRAHAKEAALMLNLDEPNLAIDGTMIDGIWRG